MAKIRSEQPKSPLQGAAKPSTKKALPTYEPPKLLKFEKLEKLIVSGE